MHILLEHRRLQIRRKSVDLFSSDFRKYVQLAAKTRKLLCHWQIGYILYDDICDYILLFL